MKGKPGKPKPKQQRTSRGPGWNPLARERFRVFPRPKLPDISLRAYRAIERMGPETIIFKIERDNETWNDRNVAYNVARRENDEILRTSRDRGIIRKALESNIAIESRHMMEVIAHTLYGLHAYRMSIALSTPPNLRISAYSAMCTRISKRLKRMEEISEKKERLLRDHIGMEQAITKVIHEQHKKR